jgi:hypothetical protein
MGVLDIVLLAISVNIITLDMNFYISFSIPLLTLIYVRWHKYGLISNGILIIVHILTITFIGGVSLTNFLSALANGLSIGLISLTLLWIKLIKKDNLKYNVGNVSILYFALYLLVGFVEFGLNSIFTGYNDLLAFGLFHLLNLFLGYGIMLLELKTKSLFVYQIEYLLSIQKGNKND